jgi:hypothetical protein
MPNVIMLIVNMPNVNMPNVIMLSVLVPFYTIGLLLEAHCDF